MMMMERFPKLADVVTRLQRTAFGHQMFDPSLVAVSQDVDQSLQKLMGSIKRQRIRYLKYKTLFETLKELGRNETDDFQVSQEIHEWVTLVDCLDLVAPDNDVNYEDFKQIGYVPKSQLLGLVPEDILRRIKWEAEKTVSRNIVPALERVILGVAQKTQQFAAMSDFREFKESLVARIQDLKRNKLLEEINLRKSLEELHDTLASLLLDNLQKICEIIGEVKCRYEFGKTLVFDAYHLQVMKNIKLKLEVLRMEFLIGLYDERTVKDLSSIRDRFIRETRMFQDELQNLLQQLDDYSALGPKFRDIVAQYQNTLSCLISVHQDLERLSITEDDKNFQ